MVDILKLSDWGFKIPMINKLAILMEKVDTMQEYMSNINR